MVSASSPQAVAIVLPRRFPVPSVPVPRPRSVPAPAVPRRLSAAVPPPAAARAGFDRLVDLCRARLQAVEQQVKVLEDGQLKDWVAE